MDDVNPRKESAPAAANGTSAAHTPDSSYEQDPPAENRSPLLSGPITPTLWKFSAPLMFSFMLHMAYSWIDAYFVSRLGTEALAAIGNCEILNFLIFTFGSGFAVGAGIIVARRIGEGDRAEAQRIAAQAFIGMFAFGATLTAILWFLMPPMLSALGLQGEVFELARIYMAIVLLGAPFNYLLFQTNALIRSTGNSIFPMKMLITTTLLNAATSPLLIFGIGPFPELGIAGAATGTIFSQICGAIIGLVALYKGYAGFRIPLRIQRLDLTIISGIVRLGFPSTLQMISVSLSRMGIFAIINNFGAAATASYTIGLKVDFFIFMPIFATSIAIETITGQHLGARKTDRIFQFYTTALRHLFIVTCVYGVGAYFLAPQFAGIFNDTSAVISATTDYLQIMAFSYPFFMIGVISSRLLRGAGASLKALVYVAGVLMGLQLPTSYYLGVVAGYGTHGVWIGMLIGYIILAALGVALVYEKSWMHKKV